MNTAFLIVTDECNLNCAWCFNKNIPDSNCNKDILDTDGTLEIIDKISSLGFKDIIFTGGEPLLNKDIYTFIKHTRSKNLDTLLLTNGLNVDIQTLEKLTEAGLNAITLSLNKLTGDYSPEDLNNTRKKINMIKEYFNNLTVTILITKKNMNDLNKFYKSFDNVNCSIIFQPIYIKDNTELKNKLCISSLNKEHWKEITLQLADWLIKYNTYTYFQLIKDSFTGITPKNLTCFMGSRSMVIDRCGNVYPCFHRRDIITGNLKNDDPEKILISLLKKSDKLIAAPCFGQRCVSLFINR